MGSGQAAVSQPKGERVPGASAPTRFKQGSHTFPLVMAFCHTWGDVLELGAGPCSTPLLHWLCERAGRLLITVDDNPHWLKHHQGFQGPGHIMIPAVCGWDALNLSANTYGLVLVDHWPASRRGKDVLALAESADVILAHDAEDEESNGYKGVFSQFKYARTWQPRNNGDVEGPWTALLSQSCDVGRWLAWPRSTP